MTITKRRGHVFSLPIGAITHEGGSPREAPEPGALYALADSIEKYGVLHDPDACFAYIAAFPERQKQLSMFD